MKKLLNSLVTVTFLSMLLVATGGSKASAQDVTVSYQTFYDELAPYGQWVYDPEYGNVWVPNESGDFRPYGTRGHWVMTEYGNTWVSNDPWGWACYHYGRWTFNSYYGWIWIPGYEWAPAWVSWRYGGGYCGWAPLGPGFSAGYAYNCPESWWVFIGPQYLYHDDYYRYWRGPRYNHEYFRRTSVYDNVYTDNYSHVRYNYGPRASAIQQYTHQPVQVYRVAQSNRPGAQPIQQNTVSLYRPSINRNTISTARPGNVIQAPRNIGRPEANADLTRDRQPAFRQEVVKQNAANPPRNTGVVGPRNVNNQPNNTQPRVENNNGVRNNPAPQQPNNQGRINTQPTPGVRNNPNPQAQPNRPQPQHFEPQNQPNRPEQPRNNPQPQPRQQEQPHYNPQPQPRPQEQPHNNPQPQPRPQAQPQPHNNPQPQPRPQQNNHEEPKQGGRR